MQRDKIKIDLLVHDLKVPLVVIEAGINSLLHKLDKYGPLTEQQEKVLMRVLRNTKVIQTLVNDVLELSRSREGVVNLQDLRISDLIEQVLEEIFDLVDDNASERIKTCTDLSQLQGVLRETGLMLSITEDLWCQQVCLDEAKVKQIVRNLLNNALKHRKTRVELEINTQEDHLVCSVKDDGEGIPSAYHKKIFESYFQIDDKNASAVRGHGLGLAGVMVLVEDMGGELSLESDVGKGVRFVVKVPLGATK